MTPSESFERTVALRVNFDRALRFPSPVVVSADPSLTLVGFSISSRDGVDVTVEAHHLSRSGEGDQAAILTLRSSVDTDDPEEQWSFHTLDYLMAARSLGEDSRLGLLLKIREAERETAVSSVEDLEPQMDFFHVEGDRFARFELGDALYTVAAPASYYRAGFVQFRG